MHQLRFHKISNKDGSGKCDALKTGNAEHRIYGVLYEIPKQEKAELDKIEGVGYGYEEHIVEIQLSDGSTTPASTYTATDIDDSLRPLDWYKELVLQGARENRLPDDYIKAIECIECEIDSRPERRKRELFDVQELNLN